MLKTFPKILIIFFLTVFVLQLICLFFLWIAPAASQAAGVEFKPQVVQDLGYTFNPADKTTGNIANLVKAIYKYAIGIVGILAAVVLMVGGVLWIVAGGNATAIGEAKSWIGASLTGLVLALTSYLILATVNPALVDLKTTEINKVGNVSFSNKFDDTVACGQQLPGAEGICGSKCPAGQKCEKVPIGTAGAKDCIVGGDDWWLCSSISGGGTACCTDNNDSQCLSGYVCNMQMITGSCVGKGTCALKQILNGICGENNDCASGDCDAGVLATNRCK